MLKPFVDRLTGVDLSAQMLDKANETGAYDALLQEDIVHFLRSTQGNYDLVLAADVLIYLGDLRPLFAAAARVLVPTGLFCFSVEMCRSSIDKDFELQASLRYAHSEAHVRRLAAAHALQIVQISRAPIRHDQREAIEGLFFVLARSTGAVA